LPCSMKNASHASRILAAASSPLAEAATAASRTVVDNDDDDPHMMMVLSTELLNTDESAAGFRSQQRDRQHDRTRHCKTCTACSNHTSSIAESTRHPKGSRGPLHPPSQSCCGSHRAASGARSEGAPN
jgi:hypothetical protein